MFGSTRSTTRHRLPAPAAAAQDTPPARQGNGSRRADGGRLQATRVGPHAAVLGLTWGQCRRDDIARSDPLRLLPPAACAQPVALRYCRSARSA